MPDSFQKIWIAFCILLIAPLLAGIYGILHDQLTYTIAPEYYTRFKFIQFGLQYDHEIPVNLHRLNVCVVGFLATWWVGIPIGIVLGGFSFRFSDSKIAFRRTFRAILLLILVAFITGLIGLFYGYFFIGENVPEYWYLPKEIVHKTNFIAVGSMHNFSYLGGLIGLVFAVFYVCRK